MSTLEYWGAISALVFIAISSRFLGYQQGYNQAIADLHRKEAQP